jgi:hypothetical protein
MRGLTTTVGANAFNTVFRVVALEPLAARITLTAATVDVRFGTVLLPVLTGVAHAGAVQANTTVTVITVFARGSFFARVAVTAAVHRGLCTVHHVVAAARFLGPCVRLLRTVEFLELWRLAAGRGNQQYPSGKGTSR